MTISSTATRKAGPYAGNGSTVAFAFSFKVFADSDLVVTHTDDNGLETVKTLTTHYTATLNANQNSNPGGTVTMLTAPATGEKLTITSAVPKTQAVNLSDGGGFFASVVNNALDRLTIFSQELAERLGRAMSLPVSVDAGVSAELPTPTAGKLLAWASDGLSIVNSAPTGVVAGSITATELASDAVEEDAILNGAVTTNKLGALAVTAAKLAADAVETAKIKDANVTNGKLSANAVTLAKTDASGLQPIVVLRDEKASGTSGGTFNSGAWQTRDLNTKATDTHSICTLAANQFSLPAGTYEINVRAPCFLTGQTKAKLRNVSDGSDTIIGASGYAYGAAGGDAISSTVDGVFTIASSKTFEVQHRCATTSAVSGFGYADGFSVVEVYTEVFIRKIA